MRGDVEFVLQKPENWYPHADGRITLVRESDSGDIPGVGIDFRFEKNGAVRIASVYRLTKRSLVKKMKQKKVAIEALSQTGDARQHAAGHVDPGQLAIADYLRMQRQAKDDGSWLPSSPSGEPLKASTANERIQGHAPVDVNQHRVDEMGESDREQAPLVAELSGDEVLSLADHPVRAARKYYSDNLQGSIAQSVIGPVRFSRIGWKKLQQKGEVDQVKLKLIPAIKSVIERGEYQRVEPLYKPRKDDIVRFHQFSGEVMFEGRRYLASVLVGEDAKGNLFYTLKHENGTGDRVRTDPGGAAKVKRSVADDTLNIKLEQVGTVDVNQHRAHLRRAFGKAAETPENIVVTTLAASHYGRGLRPKPGRIDALLADTGLRESEIGSIIGHDVGGLTDAEINLIRTSTRKGGAAGLRKLFGGGEYPRGSSKLAGKHQSHHDGEGVSSDQVRGLDDTPLYSRKPGGSRHGNQHPNANPFERFDKKSLLTGMKEAAKGHAAGAATIGYTIGRAFYFSMR